MLIKGQLPLPDRVNRILVIQLGDIGDVVTTIPSLKAIKNRHPEAEISVLLRSPNEEILVEETCISNLFSIKTYPGRWLKNLLSSASLLCSLRKERFDLAIDLRADDRGAYTAFLTGAPIRVAMHYQSLAWRDRFFTHLVPERKFDSSLRGPEYQSLEVLRPLGMESDDPRPSLRVSVAAQRKVKDLLMEKGIELSHQRLATINPFSRWRYKEWPYEKWIAVALKLMEKWDMRPILIGSSNDMERAKEMEILSEGRLLNIAGKTSLKDLIALLSLATLHLGIDSAATHIAAAVGTPTITIFGPTDWRDWAPKGEMHRVIHDERPCVPCRMKGCDNSERSLCLIELSPEFVTGEVEKFVVSLGDGK